MTLWTAAHQASLSFTITQSLLKLMFIESVMPSSHLILCCSLVCLPSIFPSIRVFSSEFAFGIRWPKYWSFSFGINPFNEYFGLISFRIDWFDLAIQGILKSSPAPQFESIYSSVLSLLYGPALISIHNYWKNHSFDYINFVSKVMSLLFNTLSRFVIAFLPRNKCLLNFMASWLLAVILEPPKIESVTVSTSPPSIFHEVMELDAMVLVF